MLVCDAGKFGGSCMSECHCLDGHPCHHVDGSCTPELCAPGWWKSNCSIGMTFQIKLNALILSI